MSDSAISATLKRVKNGAFCLARFFYVSDFCFAYIFNSTETKLDTLVRRFGTWVTQHGPAVIRVTGIRLPASVNVCV